VDPILTTNPYSTLVDMDGQPGLEQFGWKGKWDKRASNFTNLPSGYDPWVSLPDDLNNLFINLDQTTQTFYLLVNLPEADASVCSGELTLDSGITIYINKKWKNVLVNITINDNTITSDKIIMDETRNLERDSLYVLTNGRLTTANFIRQLNDLDKLYGFVDYTSYVVIEEDGRFKRFNFKNDLDKLPYLMICEEPDAFELKNDSLRYKINTVDKNVLKSSRYLVNGQLDNLEKIDFYNDLPLGVEIQNVKSDLPVLKNFNSQKSPIFQNYFRHSGYYMPIFYEVELFTNADLYDTGKLCEAQFVLDVQNQSVDCPILTWQVRFNDEYLLIPLYYVGEFNGTYSYQGQLYEDPLKLQWNSSEWEIFNPSLTLATSSTLIGIYESTDPSGTYSIISCSSTQSYCVRYTPSSTNEELVVPAYPLFDDATGELINYFISGDQKIEWHGESNSWQISIDDQGNPNNIECTYNLPGNQSEFPVGNFNFESSEEGCGGTIVISDIQNCLNDWFPEGTQFQSGQTQVTFYFESGELNTSQTISVAAPTSYTPEGLEEFYAQVIDLIQEQEIFSDKALSFEIYEPGNDNIHPQISQGYWVLSIKYESEICDLRIKAGGATEAAKTYCLTIQTKSFQFGNPFAEVNPQNQDPLILPLTPGPIENGSLTYETWVSYNNQYFEFKVYFDGEEWVIENGDDIRLFESQSFEGDYNTVDPSSISASISEGNCNTICVTTIEDGVVRRSTFIVVSALYNGKNFYSATLNGTLHLIRWEDTPVAGWYLINQIVGPLGYVENTSIPIGTWESLTSVDITSQETNCPLCNIELSADPTPVLCNGESNGSVTLTPTNGVSPYYYESISGAIDGLPISSSESEIQLNNLSSGQYKIQVTDSEGCSATVQFEITQPPALSADFSNVTQPNENESNGVLGVSVSGGVDPYTYQWFQGTEALVSTGTTARNLVKGIYTVLITDANGCQIAITITLNTLPPP